MAKALENQPALPFRKRSDHGNCHGKDADGECCAVVPSAGVYILGKPKPSVSNHATADAARLAAAKARISKYIKKQSG